LKYMRTGGLFEVRKVTKDFVILNSRDGSSQIMTGTGSFDFLFEKIPPAESLRKGLNSGLKYPFLAGGLAR
jgi:hypothetical protein